MTSKVGLILEAAEYLQTEDMEGQETGSPEDEDGEWRSGTLKTYTHTYTYTHGTSLASTSGIRHLAHHGAIVVSAMAHHGASITALYGTVRHYVLDPTGHAFLVFSIMLRFSNLPVCKLA